MAKNMVLTYLHLLDPGIHIDHMDVNGFGQRLFPKSVYNQLWDGWPYLDDYIIASFDHGTYVWTPCLMLKAIKTTLDSPLIPVIYVMIKKSNRKSCEGQYTPTWLVVSNIDDTQSIPKSWIRYRSFFFLWPWSTVELMGNTNIYI